MFQRLNCPSLHVCPYFKIPQSTYQFTMSVSPNQHLSPFSCAFQVENPWDSGDLDVTKPYPMLPNSISTPSFSKSKRTVNICNMQNNISWRACRCMYSARETQRQGWSEWRTLACTQTYTTRTARLHKDCALKFMNPPKSFRNTIKLPKLCTQWV